MQQLICFVIHLNGSYGIHDVGNRKLEQGLHCGTSLFLIGWKIYGIKVLDLSKIAQNFFLINNIFDKCIFETYDIRRIKEPHILINMKSMLEKQILTWSPYFLTAKHQWFTWNNSRVSWISWTWVTYCHNLNFPLTLLQ